MNLPFGLPVVRDLGTRKREGSPETMALYEHKLAQYRDTLDYYKKCIIEYSGKLEGHDRRAMDNQLSIVQMALDLTYLKEQGDKTVELLTDINKGRIGTTMTEFEGLVTTMVETNYKLDGLDKNVVNRISELLVELQKQSLFQNKQFQTELASSMDILTKRAKRGHALLWFLFIFNLISISGIVFLILYTFDIIPF